MPRSLLADGASLLIVAVSGRALAASARRAGFVPLVADFFADTDTRQIAHCYCKLDDLKGGFQWKALAPALEALAEAAPAPLLGVVYGAGFEDRTALLAKIAERWPLIGNGPSAVARVKAPEMFFAELARLGIPHPRTVMDPAAAESGWLAKRQGGAGGSHIVGNRAAVRHKAVGRLYFQEKVVGRPVSVLFAGTETSARVLGFSEQWAAPTPRSKWRYGGAAQPAELSRGLKARLIDNVELVGQRLGLKGLGSADFLVDGEDSYLLEINPRPGATLDIFDSETTPLLRIHAEAVLHNRLPTAPLNLPAATASAIVYATEPITVSQAMIWPDWTADRPESGERIDKERPICTVWARSRTKVEARHLVEKRISFILAACAGREGGS
ncbi:MAG TPA: ATP-grasp domain-containing protein [Methyloceanibacter sp.]|nr:ATP-grasp domain-containing protein [Methyloceanibacter sp.]